MDYMGLMNRFWSLHRQCAFEAADMGVYFCLLDHFNDKRQGKVWPESVPLTDSSLAMMTGFNVKTMDRARTRLVQRGLITVTKLGQGSRAGSIYAIGSTSPATSPATYPKKGEVNGQHTPSLPPQHTPQHTPKKERFYIYKEYQTPNRQTLNRIVCVADRDDASVRLAIVWCLQHKKPKAKQKKAPPSGAPPQFPDTWTDEMCRLYVETWIPYYRRRTGRNMTEDSRRLQIEKLSILNEAELKACLESSISNNYQGVFPDKFKQRHEQRAAYTGSGNQRQRNGNRQSLAETGSEIDRLAEEYFGPQY